jgi:excisionase family DNA binding protein
MVRKSSGGRRAVSGGGAGGSSGGSSGRRGSVRGVAVASGSGGGSGSGASVGTTTKSTSTNVTTAGSSGASGGKKSSPSMTMVPVKYDAHNDPLDPVTGRPVGNWSPPSIGPSDPRREFPLDGLCTVPQAAEYLGIDSTLMRRYVKQGRLPAHWTGNSYLLDCHQVRMFAQKPRRRGRPANEK